MILSDDQVTYIENSLTQYGVIETELNEGLTDHICTYIENGDHTDFQIAYNEALQKFGGQFGLFALQRQTFYAVALKKILRRKKLQFIVGFLAAFLISTALIFKLMHWPYAGLLIFIGFIILNFGFLPLFFYNRYKSSKNKLFIN
ncbi:hypothetical protein [Flavobacterium psychrotrophum]|uniref:hypothetical protein n=1 Tax=Flavobacterium psychrotrophum TaxID=2294119 RepID=UPI001F0999BD|nr:hypothetical protein [Flavobacterium psychrotrophum]